MSTAKKRSGRGVRVGIAAISTVFALLAGATTAGNTYSTLISNSIGGTLYKTVETGDAEPISNGKDNGMSLSDWKQEADELVQEVAGEGIVMLKNDASTLPLAKGSKVTLFGRSSVDLVYGGTGAGGIDTTKAVNLKDAMETDGMFDVNDTMWDFYKTYDGKDGYIRSNGSYFGTKPEDLYVAEPPVSEYTDAVRQSYGDYSDAAVVVFSRVGGEGSDMPTGDFGDGTKYLSLQPQEKAVLKEIKDSGKFSKIIALINTSNAMELSWVDQQEYGVNACLWVGGVGQSGARSIAKVLDGEINPSGRLVDTYATDSMSSPAMQNFGDYTFSNADDIVKQVGEANNGTKYVVYREGIYVGYRYYETRYADSVLDPNGTNASSSAGAFAADTWKYDDEVTYPFGYGLSYGADDGDPYDEQLVSAKVDDSGVTATIKVTNTGTAAGKDVVQLYAQQPYTKGGLEKSAVQLIGFDKTDVLQPGESTEVTITSDRKNFATYDSDDTQAYVLDAGEYLFAVGDSAHDALNNMLAKQGKTVADGMDAAGDADQAAVWNNAERVVMDTAYSGEKLSNKFEAAGLEHYGKKTGYLTRADWTTFPESYTDLEATDEMISDINAAGTYEPENSDESPVVTGAKNDKTIAQMAGLDFDDPEWDKILDQLTVDEMLTLVMRSAKTAIPSIAYPAVQLTDGPQGNNNRKYVEDGTSATGFCAETVSAATFNRDLLKRIGDAKGEDWIRTDTIGSYSPAVNTHRTPYAGRNYEYYAEDGYLAGEMGYEEVVAMQARGLITTIKHFVLNDQETNRIGVCTFANEQSIREIYLKAFEKAFTEGKANGTMGAFNRIGARWSGAYEPLMRGVVRGEWGSTAIIDTDIAINTSEQSVQAGLVAGTTMWATSQAGFYQHASEIIGKDAKMIRNLREASHYVLYNLANSNAVNGLTTMTRVYKTTPYWLAIAYAALALLALVDLLLIAVMVRRYVRVKHVAKPVVTIVK
ncbi:glycoside hydrolase family 3 protein [Bifidobacterium aerophilum]|nr:glycoside hydrolase family 3 protein [Bifidobacterium aerophilum]